MSESIRSRQWRPEGGSIFRGQLETVTEYRCRRCGAIGDFMFIKGGYCPEHRPPQAENNPEPGPGDGICDFCKVPATHTTIDGVSHDVCPDCGRLWTMDGNTKVYVEDLRPSHPSLYRDSILEMLGGSRCHYDLRHVEAYIRLEHSTLDHLDKQAMEREVAIAISCIDIGGKKKAESLARSFGL